MKGAVAGISCAVLAALLALVPADALGQRLLVSGQTTSYGPGSDGDVRAGLSLAYTDNGDGTITDNNTGLMWEKKDDSGGIHDQDNIYKWTPITDGCQCTLTGTMVTQFLATLNQEPCFAGHCDWRIPNITELTSLVDFEVPYPGPTVNAAFHNPAGCKKCADVTQPSCSCTASRRYWTSTTVRWHPEWGWLVNFAGGELKFHDKFNSNRVRAVRGGL